MVENIAITDAAVLLRGESGVGKDLVARAIHAASKRSDGPFIKVNCAAIPHGLLESELFGHEKGAFTGAHRRRPGHFEYANKGTIYLDEIGELPMSLQAKVLHVLQDLTFSRVGGEGMIEVDVRIIAATNRDLEQAIAHREFREDLYYRLNVVPIELPALRARHDDVVMIATHFLRRFAREYDLVPLQLSPGALRALRERRWTGNVRELRNVLERALLLARGETLVGVQHLAAEVRGIGDDASLPHVSRSLSEVERAHIERTLRAHGDNRTRAARELGISRATLIKKIREYELGERPSGAHLRLEDA